MTAVVVTIGCWQVEKLILCSPLVGDKRRNQLRMPSARYLLVVAGRNEKIPKFFMYYFLKVLDNFIILIINHAEHCSSTYTTKLVPVPVV